MLNRENYALILSGGGAKGVYHLGAWRALKELGIKIDAFIGNSIGAVIAGFLAQGKDNELEEIVKHIGLDFVLNIPEELIENGELSLTKASLASFKKFYKRAIELKGLDTSPWRELIYSHLDDEKIRKSGKDLGVVTYSISDLKPCEVFIEDMEEGHILDYLLASSAFPGFMRPEIAGKQYIDGGVYDNIPYTMARKRGYTKLIVLDISGLGMTRKLEVAGGTTIYIKCSIEMGGVLNFSREFIDSFTELGYLDTLRTFGKLKGYSYFFKPVQKMEKEFEKYLESSESQQRVLECIHECIDTKALHSASMIKKIYPDYAAYSKDAFTLLLDCAAKSMALERIKAMSYKDCIVEIAQKREELLASIHSIKKNSAKEIETLIRSELKKQKMTKAPYYYFLLIDNFLKGNIASLLKRSLCDYIKELAAGHFFISYCEEFWRK